MKALELIVAARAFVDARWRSDFGDRAALERRQQRRLRRWMRQALPRAPFYAGYGGRSLDTLPIVDKRRMLATFEAFNARRIGLDEAIVAATDGGVRADGLAFGLSSGTEGPRGVFVTSARERATWAGILLARTLSPALLRTLLFRRTPLRVAFFLRSDSGLYRTLHGARLDLRFFDLMQGIETHRAALQALRPEVLVAPASVLAWLAEAHAAGVIALAPRRVISVAEVLEPDDARRIAAAFGGPVHQLYQCTEGFLAATCEHGVLHLNEEFVHIEPEWLDAERVRFRPIVTDFTRTTQLVARYRMNDLLRMRSAPCRCGRVTRAIEAIDGRSDDVLWLPSATDGTPTPLFPDALRHVLTRRIAALADYRLEQHGETFRLATVDRAGFVDLRDAFDDHFRERGLVPPRWEQVAFEALAAGAKRRRVRCVSRP